VQAAQLTEQFQQERAIYSSCAYTWYQECDPPWSVHPSNLSSNNHCRSSVGKHQDQ